MCSFHLHIHFYLNNKNYIKANEFANIIIYTTNDKQDLIEHYVEAIDLLSEICSGQKKYDLAIYKSKESLNIKKIQFGEVSKEVAKTYGILGDIYLYKKDFKEAEKYLLSEYEIIKFLYGKDDPRYYGNLFRLASFYYDYSKPNIASNYCIEINQLFITHLKNRISFYSNKELKFYIENEFYFRYLIFSFLNKYPNSFKDLTITTFENESLIKNFSLKNNKSFAKEINSDETLKPYLLNLKNKKNELQTYNISNNLKSKEQKNQIENQIELIEKNISKLTYNNKLKNLFEKNSYNDISIKLKENEVIIDLISFYYFDTNDGSESQPFYSVFLIKNNNVSPLYIPLFKEKQLEFLLAKSKNEKESTHIDKQYTEKAISDLFFKPLVKELENVTTIYLSPSGLGNQIDFAALSVSETQTLGEKYKVHILGSTAEIINYKEAGLDKKSKLELLLYGDIDYDKSEGLNTLVNATLENNSDTEFAGLATRSGITKWNYLTGTKKEVEQIKSNSQQNGFVSTIINGREATEESIKQLDGRTMPFVLHLATHGFFFPDPKTELPENKPKLFEDNKSHSTRAMVYKVSEDPMMRSGLLFAGANNYWGKPTDNLTTDDGILTSNEISNLDLSACQLVVLSACDTGLGDINGSEGVFGLQRAFKMAGVKNIIMSLWKVPDEQTSELFDVFYSECFSGKTIHEAFQIAQAKMKAKYSPYYWAGFVLLE
ncbi:CHAT domain-containing protein [Flavobacterium gawalongense]|uniref:CHAT domain-containing protein n=1 Tax=Flavobacterium gawalongense TaxID=2594432 RepID=A0A553BDD3_9FLAO|nr:CHAT domain-containing tetratricopeptide repeat protein [Flavobacterium gawalongense]TRX06260.1 CHAT domain-containing protein [Flavobacterium gawalongense]TRX07004.1 CHAT domain-containing protein [Flavobacterium gawalongense]TRX23107.1 CHAT domain-containing protein [Flavobacterium gawalongense]